LNPQTKPARRKKKKRTAKTKRGVRGVASAFTTRGSWKTETVRYIDAQRKREKSEKEKKKKKKKKKLRHAEE